jgi:hypothetical protein
MLVLREVNADLMGASGLERAGNEARRVQLFQQPHVRDCALALRQPGREALAVARVPAVPGVEREASRRMAEHDRDVLALQVMLLELGDQPFAGGHGLGNDHDAARVLVEAVDDPRTLGRVLLDLAHVAVIAQRVHERATRVPGSRMHHHAGRLHQHQHVLVFVQQHERDVFRLGR